MSRPKAADKTEDVVVSAFTNQWFSFARAFFKDKDEDAPSSPLVAGAVPASSTSETSSVSERLVASDPAFAAYLRRVRDADKTYVSTKRDYLLEGRGAQDLTDELNREYGADSAAISEAAVAPAVDVNGHLVAIRWTHSKWPDMVAREYLQKKKRFGARLATTLSRVKYLVLALILLLITLYAIWPVWNFLIDIDADVHFRTLGITSSASKTEIKKAYRVMAKKWHPDSNPGCGEQCSAMMREIQRAHDILLAKGGKDTSDELKRNYQEAVSQILAFVFYRGFAMAFNTATMINYFLEVPRTLGLSPRSRAQCEQWIHMAVKGTVLLLFVYFTIAHVTGSNIVMLLIGGFRVLTQLREDVTSERNVGGIFDDDDAGARTSGSRNLVKALTLSNFNLPQCVFAFLLPSIALHFAWTWMYTVSPGDVNAPAHLPAFMWGRFLFQLVYGSIFVSSILIALPPNLWDNLTMMECTVPQAYFATQVDIRGNRSMKVTFWSFLSCEFGFLVDDIFAFATQIPAPFRVAVYIAHGLYLIQMCTLPWATPALLSTAKQVRVHQKLVAFAAAKANRNATNSKVASKYASVVEKLWSLTGEGPSTSSSSLSEDRGVDSLSQGPKTAPPVPTDPLLQQGTNSNEAPLTDAEKLIIHNMHAELVSWLNIKAEYDRLQSLRRTLSPAASSFIKEFSTQIGRHGFVRYGKSTRDEGWAADVATSRKSNTGLTGRFLAVIMVLSAVVFIGNRWAALTRPDPSSFTAASASWQRDAHESNFATTLGVFGPRLPSSRRLVNAQADIVLSKCGVAPVFITPEATDVARGKLAESLVFSRLSESLLWGTKRKKRTTVKESASGQQQQQQQQQDQQQRGKKTTRRPKM